MVRTRSTALYVAGKNPPKYAGDTGRELERDGDTGRRELEAVLGCDGNTEGKRPPEYDMRVGQWTGDTGRELATASKLDGCVHSLCLVHSL